MFGLRGAEGKLGATKQGYLWIAVRILSVSERTNSSRKKAKALC